VINWWVADHQQNIQMLLSSLDRINQRYQLLSCSGDKGFYSKEDVGIMELFGIKAVIPKRGVAV